MNDIRLLFCSNFNTSLESIFFGYITNKMYIKNGFIVLEISFDNKANSNTAYNNILHYIGNANLTKVINIKSENIEVQIKIIGVRLSLSDARKVIVEIRMPR